MALLADTGLISGHATLADLLFLAAFILFVIGAVFAVMVKTPIQVLAFAGLACVALGYLVL